MTALLLVRRFRLRMQANNIDCVVATLSAHFPIHRANATNVRERLQLRWR
jgi:hypothetical protein